MASFKFHNDSFVLKIQKYENIFSKILNYYYGFRKVKPFIPEK